MLLKLLRLLRLLRLLAWRLWLFCTVVSLRVPRGSPPAHIFRGALRASIPVAPTIVPSVSRSSAEFCNVVTCLIGVRLINPLRSAVLFR